MYMPGDPITTEVEALIYIRASTYGEHPVIGTYALQLFKAYREAGYSLHTAVSRVLNGCFCPEGVSEKDWIQQKAAVVRICVETQTRPAIEEEK